MSTFRHTKEIFKDPGMRKNLKSMGDNIPPGSPSGGDSYLIGSSPSGLWASNADELTIWNAKTSLWEFEASPPDGLHVYVEDIEIEYICIGGNFISIGNGVNIDGGAPDTNYGGTTNVDGGSP